MGFFLSLALRGPLQESIRANLGESGNDGLSFLLGMGCDGNAVSKGDQHERLSLYRG